MRPQHTALLLLMKLLNPSLQDPDLPLQLHISNLGDLHHLLGGMVGRDFYNRPRYHETLGGGRLALVI